MYVGVAPPHDPPMLVWSLHMTHVFGQHTGETQQTGYARSRSDYEVIARDLLLGYISPHEYSAPILKLPMHSTEPNVPKQAMQSSFTSLGHSYPALQDVTARAIRFY